MYIDKNFIPKIRRECLHRRSIVLLILLFLVFLFAFWNIQILHHQEYREQALRNINKRVYLQAPRGLIRDRNGRLIATNKLDFTLVIRRERARNLSRTIQLLAPIVDLSEKEIRRRIRKYRHYPASYAIPIRKNLDLREVIIIKSREEEYPGIEVTHKPMREYPLGNTLSQIIGYISELSPEEYQKRETYQLGDMIGKTGVEKEYEEYFRGKRGYQDVIIDHLNQIKDVVYEEPPLLGDTVELTIDLDLQLQLEKIFDGYSGVIGVSDLSTGGILALVSKPDFDPAFFTSIKSEAEWKALIDDPSDPLTNRFIQGVYSPGSTFKIVMTLLGLEEKLIDQTSGVWCAGQTSIYNRMFHCWRDYGHGWVGVRRAVAESCNIFFYHLGRKTDIETIGRYARLLGLGKATGIDLPNEKTGLVPSPEWKQAALDRPWYRGETISVAIGQGPLLVTPAQMLQMISTVALRGKSPRLHLLKTIQSEDGVVLTPAPDFREIPIKKEHFELLIEGLFSCVQEGTARRAKVEGLDICGKTGTVQVITKENPEYEELVKKDPFKPHSWFVSFAPKKDPRIAVVVFVENGGDASQVAVPLAAEVYRRYFNYER